jgi:hypothetical protein
MSTIRPHDGKRRNPTISQAPIAELVGDLKFLHEMLKRELELLSTYPQGHPIYIGAAQSARRIKMEVGRIERALARRGYGHKRGTGARIYQNYEVAA